MGQGGVHVAGVPQHDGVQDQAEGAQLVFLALPVGLAELAAGAVEDLAGQAVAGLLQIELAADTAPIGGIVEPGQESRWNVLGCARTRPVPGRGRWGGRRLG